MASMTREQVREELLTAPSHYLTLLDAATPQRRRLRTNGTRWTNQEMLFHLLLGYLVVPTLRPLIWMITRLPPRPQRGFAAALNAAAGPFHLVNYLGAVLGGHTLSLPTMTALFNRACRNLTTRLDRTSDADLARTMPFPTRWDPFFTNQMSLLDIYHYPWQHFQFHRRQLTLDQPQQPTATYAPSTQ